MKNSRILEYTFRELAVCGFKHASVDNIAAKLHISKRTIYDLFENKEKLLLSSIRWKVGKVIEGFSDSPKEEPNVLGTMIYNALHLYRFFYSLSPLFWQEKEAFPSVGAYLEELQGYLLNAGRERFEEGKMLGYLRKDADFEIVGRLLKSQVITMTEVMGEKRSPVSICFNSLVIILRGVCTEKGFELLETMVNSSFEQEVLE